MTRHFLRDDDLTPAEQTAILDLAVRVKADRWGRRPLEGPQTVAVIFDKSSTRTRVSFAVGIADLGGSPLIISTANSQLGGKETPPTPRACSSGWSPRSSGAPTRQAGLEEMAAGTTVPVVNALSDDFHPCQLLADLLTIREHKGRLAGSDGRVRRRRRRQHGAQLPAGRRDGGHARARRPPGGVRADGGGGRRRAPDRRRARPARSR